MVRRPDFFVLTQLAPLTQGKISLEIFATLEPLHNLLVCEIPTGVLPVAVISAIDYLVLTQQPTGLQQAPCFGKCRQVMRSALRGIARGLCLIARNLLYNFVDVLHDLVAQIVGFCCTRFARLRPNWQRFCRLRRSGQ